MSLVNRPPAGKILRLIQTNQLQGKLLPQKDRINVVRALRVEGWSVMRIAHTFEVPYSTIDPDPPEIERHPLQLREFVSPERLAGRLLSTAGMLTAKALATGDLDLVWQITKELPEELAKYHFIDLEKVPDRSEVTHKFEDGHADAFITSLRARGSEQLAHN